MTFVRSVANPEAAVLAAAKDMLRRGLVEGNTIFRTLERFPGQSTWRKLALDAPVELLGPGDRPTGVTVTAVTLPGKVPKHLEGLSPPSPEDNVGLWIRDRRTGALVAAPA